MPLSARRIFIVLAKTTAVMLAGLVLASLLLWYAPVRPLPWVPSIRWWSLAGTTAVVFWVAVKQYRRHWHRPSFWLKVSGLLALHLLAYVVILIKVPEWRLLWFVPPSVIEGGVLVLLLDKFISQT